MVILRNANKKNYNSIEAYYEPEPGNPDEDVTVKDGKHTFMWRRRKSNENIANHGFSFYLARHVFKDKYKIFDDDLANDNKNTGVYGIVEGDKKVMLVIHAQSEYLEKGIARIVSAYYTSDQNLIKNYEKIKGYRRKSESLMPDDDELKSLKELHLKILRDFV